MNNALIKSVAWGLFSALLLGMAQPLFMPDFFASGPWPEFLGALSLVAYVPLFLLLKNKNLKATFGLSFMTMTVQYAIVLSWIFIAVHVYGYVPTLPASIITLLLPMLMALKGAIFFTIARFLSMHFNRSFLWFAPIALCALEYFRNFHVFGGFPWGNSGYSLGRIPEFLQLASVVGIYGVVFFVGLINALISVLILFKRQRRRCLGMIALLVLGAYGFGALRISQGANEFAPKVRIALLQGNIPQEVKNKSGLHAEDILAIYGNLQQKAIDEEVQLIVWPESAYPWLVDQAKSELELKKSGVASVIGATTYAFDRARKFSHYQNSAFFLDYSGQIVGRYDKTHLVPFGEYVPWPMINVVDKIVPGMGAYKPGFDFIPIHLPLALGKNVAIGTAICYEDIFPEISRAFANNGATLLVNITNDAWFGETSAPYQHLLMNQFRAVESGRPYVRATNSGVSAFIDAYGKIHKQMGLFERGMIIAEVPLINKATVYLVIGDVVPVLCMLFLIIGFVAALIPLRSFLKNRRWRELSLVALFSGIALVSYWYFNRPEFLGVESAGTKNLWIIVLSIILLVGSLSNSKRSRAILLSVASGVVFISVALAIFESLYFLAGLLVGVLIYLLAFRMSKDDKTSK